MQKITKILVANRGEIAVRVMRTAKQMGYSTVAVYSDADLDCLHVASADEAVCLGEPAAAKSYLRIDKVIAAAQQVGADAIHPGYGFLSENADFARACSDAGIVFIGPPAEAIELMGSKRLSKIAMLDSDVPCIPGYQGADQSDQTLLAKAKEIGMPLMIKASAGGGGRGMRLVLEASDISTQLNTARTEALNAFGSDEVILERALIEPRHIEIQVFADAHGNVVYLGERDCSIQRRHQKVVEEAPSPFIDQDLRERMGQAAVNAARACDYRGAGTVEFLVDANRDFYFLEMNTRLQVEHPVTEMITGLDLVRWQLLVAAGEVLPLRQEQIEYSGHAIEVRIYAEDPRNDFMPQTGKVIDWCPSQEDGIRVDSGIQLGQNISPFYDPMLAKVIAYKNTRAEALTTLRSALADTTLLGVNHNIQFLGDVLGRERFAEGGATTAFLGQEYPDGIYQAGKPLAKTLALAAVLYYRETQLDGRYYRDMWSSAEPLETHLHLAFNAETVEVAIKHVADRYILTLNCQTLELTAAHAQASEYSLRYQYDGVQSLIDYAFENGELFMQNQQGHFKFSNLSYAPACNAAQGGDSTVKAAMDGAIVEILVDVGEEVQAGQTVAVLEAMKMAHQLKAGVSGKVAQVHCDLGQQVKTRQLIVSLEVEE
ncbi:MAG: geranyl-CoA carboxylase alpha subunit [Cryomorphaceae bacterium]|jgi:geranyl-CoA carboxylase alpha subunit